MLRLGTAVGLTSYSVHPGVAWPVEPSSWSCPKSSCFRFWAFFFFKPYRFLESAEQSLTPESPVFSGIAAPHILLYFWL